MPVAVGDLTEAQEPCASRLRGITAFQLTSISLIRAGADHAERLGERT